MSVERNLATAPRAARRPRTHADVLRRAPEPSNAKALSRRSAAERHLAGLPHSWVGDELVARTALGMIGAVTLASIVTLLYLSLL